MAPRTMTYSVVPSTLITMSIIRANQNESLKISLTGLQIQVTWDLRRYCLPVRTRETSEFFCKNLLLLFGFKLIFKEVPGIVQQLVLVKLSFLKVLRL